MDNGLERFLQTPVIVIAIGLRDFAESLKEQGVEIVQANWTPPAGGDEELADFLEKLLWPGFFSGQTGTAGQHPSSDDTAELQCTGTDRTRGDTSGHKSGARSCPIVIQQGFRSAEGYAQWLPEPMRLANQVKAAEIWPEAVLWFSLDVI